VEDLDPAGCVGGGHDGVSSSAWWRWRFAPLRKPTLETTYGITQLAKPRNTVARSRSPELRWEPWLTASRRVPTTKATGSAAWRVLPEMIGQTHRDQIEVFTDTTLREQGAENCDRGYVTSPAGRAERRPIEDPDAAIADLDGLGLGELTQHLVHAGPLRAQHGRDRGLREGDLAVLVSLVEQ